MKADLRESVSSWLMPVWNECKCGTRQTGQQSGRARQTCSQVLEFHLLKELFMLATKPYTDLLLLCKSKR